MIWVMGDREGRTGFRIGRVATRLAFDQSSADHNIRHSLLYRFGVVGPEFNPAMFKMDRDLKGFKMESPVPHPDACVFKEILFRIITFSTGSNIDS
jgi:hypothetical protein